MRVFYDPESDTLVLWDGTAAIYGMEIAKGLTLNTDEGGVPHMVSIDGAAAMFRDVFNKATRLRDVPTSQLLHPESE